MSQSGHFRAHGRREVDLSAVLDRGEAAKMQDRPEHFSTVPARPIRPPAATRKRSSDPLAPRVKSNDSSSPPSPAGEPIRIVNLSLGGACIEAAEPVPVGASLALEIVAPTLWDPLVLKARVVWSRNDRGLPARAGLSFEHTDAARAFALFELLGAHDYEV